MSYHLNKSDQTTKEEFVRENQCRYYPTPDMRLEDRQSFELGGQLPCNRSVISQNKVVA